MIGKVLLSVILILQSSLAYARGACERDLKGANLVRQFDKIVNQLDENGFKEMTTPIHSGEIEVETASSFLPWTADIVLRGHTLVLRRMDSSNPLTVLSVAKILVEYKTLKDMEDKTLTDEKTKLREALLLALEQSLDLSKIPVERKSKFELSVANLMRAVMIIGTLYSVIQAPAYFEEYVNHPAHVLTQGEQQIVQERDRLIAGIRFQMAKPAPKEAFLKNMKNELKVLHDKYPELVESATIP